MLLFVVPILRPSSGRPRVWLAPAPGFHHVIGEPRRCGSRIADCATSLVSVSFATASDYRALLRDHSKGRKSHSVGAPGSPGKVYSWAGGSELVVNAGAVDGCLSRDLS